MASREETEREEFAALLDRYAPEARGKKTGPTTPEPGSTVSGRVIEIGPEAVFVDLGGKAEGILDRLELADDEGRLTVAVGDTVEAQVAGTDPESGAVRLRKRFGRGADVSQSIREAHALGVPVEGRVAEVVKGGLQIDVGGLRAFCPASQADLRYVENLGEMVGRRLTFKITKLEEGRGKPNLVLSRRAVLEDEARSRAAEARERIHPGSVVTGRVTALAAYGAFVDLGGVEGMLHVSEISHTRLSHPQEALSVGQEIEVQVLKVEPGKDGRDRISLSRRALEASPWQDVERRFPLGGEHAGMVKRLESYGAFVEIAPGLEGLLHVSELGRDRRVSHPREVLSLGQEVRVRVKSVEPDKRRISLVLAPAAAEATVDELERYASGEKSGGFGAMGDFLGKRGR
jgi:small subunit ribosomal protein S1